MSSDDGGDGGYVHDPATFDDGGLDADGEEHDSGGDPTAGADGGTAGSATAPGVGNPARQEFGRGGWLLVGLLVVCLFVVPGVILVRPPGLPWEVAFLVLPLLPGFLLGGAAVWTALRSRQP